MGVRQRHGFGLMGWGFGKNLGLAAYSDSFTGDNGDPLDSRWTGGTWDIQSNSARNQPTAGAEILANPGMEGVYVDESGGGGGTVNVAPNWGKFLVETDGSDEMNEELVIVHGGSKSQKLDIDATNEGMRTDVNIFNTNGWYLASVWFYGDGNAVRLQNSNAAYLALAASPGAAWEQVIGTCRSTATSNLYVTNQSGGGTVFYVDDASAKALTLSTLFASVDGAAADASVQVDATITASTQAGVVVCLDDASSPANFVIGYHDGTKANLVKCVGGTYTSLISTTTAYAAGAPVKVIKTGTSAELYYNGNKIGATQTVSDSGIVSNVLHGMFNTYSANRLDDFVLVAP